jgi:phage terminase large subunit GpA-like protein
MTAVASLFETTTRLAQTPRLRSMRQFAEQEIVLPSGPFKGRRFDSARTPFAALWFAEMDRGWRRFAAVGPQQSSKTLIGSTIPVLFHLFEAQETVIYSAPTLEMAQDKWQQDVLPVIAASRYRDLLPKGGAGSRGGESSAIVFDNGATLRFLTGGGADKSRAGFTSRILVVTEVDGMDEVSGASRESDKITQLEGRTAAYGDSARVYLECTVSKQDGRIWRELKQGTDSRVALRCPHCRAYVTPEREHLAGWHEAQDVLTAGDQTRIVCPACGVEWTELDRTGANRDCRLAHKGQSIDADGNVTGPAPKTLTLGMRWNAVNNLLMPLHIVGQREWTARRAPDEEAAEREMCQFVWAVPPAPSKTAMANFDSATLTTKRMIGEPRGAVPADTEAITIGLDLGGWLCHWTAIAWRKGMRPHVLDYGRVEVPQDTMALELAILNALRQFRDEICRPGWGGKTPAMSITDAGYLQDVVLRFCGESGPTFLASKGFSSTSGRKMLRQTGSKVLTVGEAWEFVALPDGNRILEVDVDRWKSWLHARLTTPLDGDGAMTLFHSTDHVSFGKHLTAERQVEEFAKGKGTVTRWEALNRNNHWLDATTLACVAGNIAGQRLIANPPPPPPPPAPAPQRTQERSSNPWIGDIIDEWRGRR